MVDIYMQEPLKTMVFKHESLTLTRLSRSRYQKHLFTLSKFAPLGAKVLDLGCGSGHFAAALKYIRPDLEIVGVQPGKEAMWKYLQKYFAISFHDGSAFDIPFKENTFDIVLSIGVMEHMDDFYEGKGRAEDAYLKEVHRVLKKGGLFFISHLPNTYSFNENMAKLLGLKHHMRPYTKKEAKAILQKHKFAIEYFEREHFIPSFFHMVSSFLGKITDKLYWLINAIDWLVLLTPLRFFCQSFLFIARKK